MRLIGCTLQDLMDGSVCDVVAEWPSGRTVRGRVHAVSRAGDVWLRIDRADATISHLDDVTVRPATKED